MQALAQPVSTCSKGYQELLIFCRAIQPPYTEYDIRAFNAIYRNTYPSLSPDERRRAETLVDLMIDGVQRRELAPLIYGVV
ncbi:MAG: hypothetical protein ACK443_09765 [Methylococcaceae bacterium]|jgi:hypothetical protein